MSIRRFSSRTTQLDQTVLLQHLQGARSYKRVAGYFTSSLFEIAHEQLESIPDIKIVCNVDIDPNDLKVAQLRESKMIGRWNDTAIEAEALWNRARYQRLDQFLAKRGQVIRLAPDSVCGFVHGKAGIIELADGRKLGFIGSMNETRSGWQRHYEILWEDDSPEGVAWLEAEFEFLWNAASPLPNAVIREVKRRGQRHEVEIEAVTDDADIAPAALIESPMYRQGLTLQPWQQEFITGRQGFGKDAGSPNELLAFMREITACAEHVLLGTATPIQTRQEDLWDLVGILHQGSGNFVLGHDLAQWHKPAEILPILAGEQRITSPEHAWRLLRSPLPLVESTQEPRARKLYSTLRSDLGMGNQQWQAGSFDKLSPDSRDDLEDELTRDAC